MSKMTHLHEVKLEVISKCMETGKLDELSEKGFFKTIDQIERSKKIKTHDRIYLGRMLKFAFNGKAPNPGNIAIFQKPDEFKDIRKWEQSQ